MAHTFSPDQHHKLDSPDRRKILPPENVLSRTGLQPGNIMADIGAGIGYFSIPAAEIVGEKGRVLAVDISEEMLKHLWSKLAEENRDKIKLILSQKDGSGMIIQDSYQRFCFSCFSSTYVFDCTARSGESKRSDLQYRPTWRRRSLL